jgi:hypothetical protein
LNKVAALFCFVLLSQLASANLIYHPVSFAISTGQESYYEGEKITFNP